MGSRLETINSALAHWIIRGFITICLSYIAEAGEWFSSDMIFFTLIYSGSLEEVIGCTPGALLVVAETYYMVYYVLLASKEEDIV